MTSTSEITASDQIQNQTNERKISESKKSQIDKSTPTRIFKYDIKRY